MFQGIKQSAGLSLIFLVLFSILIRFFSFFPSVIDHDESTYIVIADAILNGQTYFIDVIDTKPIGIFLIYAGLQTIFGPSIFMLRLLASVILGLTAFFLYKAKRKSGGGPHGALAVGMIYLILNSIFTYYGVSPNTETFFGLFTAIALWLWIEEKRSWLYFLAGFSLGLGFIIKYVVAFDALALGLFMLWMAYSKKIAWNTTIVRASLMLGGFLIPFLITIAYYNDLGHLDKFFFYTLEVSSRYPDAASLWDYVKFFFDFNLRFLPILLFAVYAVLFIRENIWTRQFAWFWMLIVWIVVLIPGKFFAHYCIQVMLPLSFLAGSFFEIPIEDRPKWLRTITSAKIGWIILPVLLALNSFFQKKDYFDKEDHPKAIATFLKSELKEGEQFYIGNYEQILYHMLNQPSLIPYVHSSLIWRPSHIQALKIDTSIMLEELKRLAPRFILINESDENYEPLIGSWLKEEYRVAKKIADEVTVYEKN